MKDDDNKKIFNFSFNKNIASFDSIHLIYVNVFPLLFRRVCLYKFAAFLKAPLSLCGCSALFHGGPELSAPDEEFDIEKKSSLLPEERCPFDAEA